MYHDTLYHACTEVSIIAFPDSVSCNRVTLLLVPVSEFLFGPCRQTLCHMSSLCRHTWCHFVVTLSSYLVSCLITLFSPSFLSLALILVFFLVTLSPSLPFLSWSLPSVLRHESPLEASSKHFQAPPYLMKINLDHNLFTKLFPNKPIIHRMMMRNSK